MNRDHFVIFETAPKYCISDSFVDHDGYSISSKGLLPTVVDIMGIWIHFAHSSTFWFTDSLNVNVYSCRLLFDHFQFTMIHGPNIPGSYATLFFTASEFTFTTSHIHSWVLFPLWLSLFIASGTISLLLSSNLLGSYQPGKFIFQCHLFVFSYCLWVSQLIDKITEVVPHSLLQWTMFCQNSPP